MFKFDAEEGRIGKCKFTIELDRRSGTYFGVEQMAIHPKGKKLFVAGRPVPELRVYDAKKGDLIRTIKMPSISTFNYFTGITVVGPGTNH